MDKPFKIFGAEYIEKSALDQFYNAMQQESVVKGALMPDAHFGYTLPIGGVVATSGTLFPAFVGYDIGCGLCAIKTPFKKQLVQQKSEMIFHSVYRSIPTGVGRYNKQGIDWDTKDLPRSKGLDRIYKDIGKVHLSSLGGGNHFISIDYDEKDNVWIVIHSGSRGVGHRTAEMHMRLASRSSKVKEGFYPLDVETVEGKNYRDDMNFCLEFALENRKLMIEKVLKDINHALTNKPKIPNNVDWSGLINRNHNHAELKDGLWIHRKGATHAEKGMLGIIPGNMLAGSFIVEGKGNAEALFSSSHGAGRLLSRTQAKQDLSMPEFEKQMRGITALVSPGTLDEAPGAYKNILKVMELQTDLVLIKHHLKPIINIKAQNQRRGRKKE